LPEDHNGGRGCFFRAELSLPSTADCVEFLISLVLVAIADWIGLIRTKSHNRPASVGDRAFSKGEERGRDRFCSQCCPATEDDRLLLSEKLAFEA
jgi:hypothetical protein